MKIVQWILLGILVLLSLSTGMVKLFSMEAEIELFQGAGWPFWLIMVFGLIQVAGGLLLIPQMTRRYGAGIMILTFSIATVVLFQREMWAFGFSSLLFIALAAVPLIFPIQASQT